MTNVGVVEDEELISTMIKLNLEQEGFAVMSFTAAEPMLAYVGNHPTGLDIVLLDIMLPGMTGEEALPRLRKLNATIPILMLTAKQDIDTRVKTLNHGADDYLPKPFNVRELIARVNALLRRQVPDGEASGD